MDHLIAAILLLSLAVSFDSYFFGFTYRLKSITVKKTTYLIIGLMTTVSFLAGYLLGDLFEMMIPKVSEYLGGFIFVFIGCYVLWQWFDEQKEKFRKYYHHESIRINFKTIWMILKNPQVADLDHSGTISGKESVFVALALSLDSFSSGIGAAFTVLPYLITAVLIGVSSMFFLGLGTVTGRILTKYYWMQQLSFLPGLIFIMLGIWNITK